MSVRLCSLYWKIFTGFDILNHSALNLLDKWTLTLLYYSQNSYEIIADSFSLWLEWETFLTGVWRVHLNDEKR